MFHRGESTRAQSLRHACVAFVALLTLGLFFVICRASVRGEEDDLFGDLEPAAAAPADAGGADDAGAAATASDDGEPVKKQNYLVWMFRSLGLFFTIVFSLLSLAMVALIVMNIVALRRSVIIPEPLTRSFGELLDEKRYQEAYELAKDDDSLLGRVLSTGLARIPTGFEKATQAMQDVEQEETMRLEHQLGYLALIGNLAPMIGLFGTVVGMIASFQAIASGGAAPSPQKLAEGIATALFTTELGLAIALPALAAFDVLKNRLARFILDVSVVSDNFMGRFSNVGAQPKR
ncbi:MAG: MotA/TolQ/ExbB proton channel family protein [Planctomycetia bacterium]|nr:MotA/TolQ/ExbB proton channel family protein [Planctomycetia bacterium]